VERFGKPLSRVPIDPPFPCPHRVENGGKGCSFCPEDGARARHLQRNLDLPKQISAGVEYVRRRYGKNTGLIAYFQSFTPTNAPLETLEPFYREALGLAPFDMAIVATRPDCLPNDIVEFLAKLNSEIPLWVELGVQTANDATLETINRGHDFAAVERAVKQLDAAGIQSAAHIIIGLPGEDIRDFRATVDALSQLPFSAVKIHNLLILKNTPLAAEYAKQRGKPATGAEPAIRPMDEYEYADVLADILPRFPREWPLTRLVADAPPERIIAPKWWMSKGQFLEYLRKRLENKAGKAGMPAVETDDGSPTLYHPSYKQHFHTTAGAASETKAKFLEPTNIHTRLERGETLEILDIGFGLGLNALSTAALAERIRGGRVEITSLENDTKTLHAAAALAKDGAWDDVDSLDTLNPTKTIEELLDAGRAENDFFSLEILSGDARATATETKRNFDAVFLDPFSPDVNPELWTYDFIRLLADKLKPGGVVATYSAAMPVRGAMLRAGLKVGATTPFGRRRSGTIAACDSEKIASPLPEKEIRIITKSTAGIPYRDPTLSWTRGKIRAFRDETLKKLRRLGVPKWFQGD